MVEELLMETSYLTQNVLTAQQGDAKQREELLSQYRPFILSIASRTCGRPVTTSDDEASIALIAFNEAIDNFQEGKGASFLGFARMVIQRRVTDYYRSQRPKVKLCSLDGPSNEYNEENYLWETAQANAEFAKTNSSLEYQYEIEQFDRVLQEYGISFDDLVLICPKHEDTRQICFKIARYVYENPLYKKSLQATRRLPVKNLARELKIHRRTVERHRKYIIAICILLIWEFTSLCEYVGLYGGMLHQEV